jgi:hypothetical protein
MKTVIYGLCDKEACVRYVGKTQQRVERRLLAHLTRARRGERGHKNNWIRQCLKDGYVPSVKILEMVDGDGCAQEIFHISKYRELGFDLTNATDGGEGTIGYVPSEETIEKLRRSHLGKRPSDEAIEKQRRAIVGIKRSEETKARMSAAQKGRKHPVDQMARLRLLNIGRKQSTEEIERRRAAQIGRKATPETREKLRLASLAREAKRRESR